MVFIDDIIEIKEMDDDFFTSQVGPGWGKLVLKYLKLVDDYVGVVYQIKEKFALLRMYSSIDDNDEFYKQVLELEDESARICEYCGSEGSYCCSKYWVKTHCYNCNDKHGCEEQSDWSKTCD